LLRPGDTIGLSGPLGAGKTCLVQGIASGLGVDRAGVSVTSPTFVLVAEYPGRVWLRHADFYRVESYARLEDAGFDDLLDGRAVVVVEWPERFPDALPEERLQLALETGPGDEDRAIRVEARGERAREIERELRARWP
jgi:tRNA threonylcarbamoyladenosine biosynthesis protein TsaE